MFLGEAEFYRTKGAKDKKKRKQKGQGSVIGEAAKGGVTGATGLAGGAWTLGEGLRVAGEKTPRLTKLAEQRILKRWVPKAAVAGLVGGASIAAIKKALEKRRKQKRK